MDASIVAQKIDFGKLEFLATRSQGPGGQHVNKTNSCIQLRFKISDSFFSDEEKQKLYSRLRSLLIQDDVIQIRVESERDQKSNKDEAYKKLIALLLRTLKDPKKRIKTKPTRSSIKKRLESKKSRSEIKKQRNFKY